MYHRWQRNSHNAQDSEIFEAAVINSHERKPMPLNVKKIVDHAISSNQINPRNTNIIMKLRHYEQSHDSKSKEQKKIFLN